jgi:RHS repeat-associated protein
MVDAAGTTKYTYTTGNQLLTESQPFSSSTLTNTYVNRLRTSLSLQQPTGVWTNSFAYDAAARMTNVTSPAGSFGYTVGASSAGGRLVKKLLLPNTSYITNTYDTVARLTGTYLDNSANSVLDSAIYGYNKANQRTTFTNAAGTYVQYSYDNVGQLAIANSSVSTENRGYAYDSAWNLHYRTNNGVLGTFTVDVKNQLVTDPGTQGDSYDSNGNLTSRQGGASYTYDDENRLVSLVNGTSYRTDFTYDGLGRLRVRTEYIWNISSWSVNTITWYVYDGSRVIQERDGTSNTPSVAYTRGPDLAGQMEGAGGIGGLLARSSYFGGNPTTHYFYHADGNGNITYLVDSSQALAASYRYDAFGNTLSSSGSRAAANVYRFSSKEVHANSGMYVYMFRFYDPNLQRWINRDPVEEAGGLNLYSYVRNEPTRFLDPFGLNRTIIFFGHMWIVIDTYDSVGNVTGQTALNFAPESGRSDYQIYNPGAIPYPKFIRCEITSGKMADEALLNRWKDMQKNPGNYPSWNPLYNCIPCSLAYAEYGLPPAIPYSGGPHNLPPTHVEFPKR